MKNLNILQLSVAAIVLLSVGTSCSTTSRVPDDDKLFTGLSKIEYVNYEKNDHFLSTQEEVEAALATAPNGSFFGSSYYRTIPYRLWIYNAFAGSESVLARWITKSFGKAPVLLSGVNPTLRAKVAQGLLRDRGYFGASVSFEERTGRNKKKKKIGYVVNAGQLHTIDTLTYNGFPAEATALIDSTVSSR